MKVREFYSYLVKDEKRRRASGWMGEDEMKKKNVRPPLYSVVPFVNTGANRKV